MSRAPGRLASFSLSKWVVTAVDERSTTGDAPLTVTLSVTAPGLSSALTVAVKPSPTWIALADDRRETGELEGERVVARRHGGKAVGAGLVGEDGLGWSSTTAPTGVTVTPGTTAFVLSVTMPLTAPVVAVTVCASADTVALAGMSHTISTATAAPVIQSFDMWPPDGQSIQAVQISESRQLSRPRHRDHML